MKKGALGLTMESRITAYLQFPRSGRSALTTQWPIDDGAVAEQLVRHQLKDTRSGRIHLPIAVQQAGENGLPLLVVQRNTVLAVMRVISATAEDVELQPDESLSAHLVGTRIRLRSRATMQIWPYHCLDLSSEALKQPDRRRSELRIRQAEASKALYRTVKASMDAPPGI